MGRGDRARLPLLVQGFILPTNGESVVGKVAKLRELFRFSGGFLAIAVIETVRANHGICAVLPNEWVLTARFSLIDTLSVLKLFKLQCMKALGRNCLTGHLDTDLIDCWTHSP